MEQNGKVWTYEELARDLRENCGIRAGQTLILHSSQHALGVVDGGVVTSVHVLKEVIGPEGTLLLPVFSNPPKDGVFKIKRTPSRVGLITEAFRRSDGVMRSLHPTHSVAAWGKRRDEFLAGHDKTSGLGVDSPFHKAAKAGADVLMIGCDFNTLSLIHCAEAAAKVPYLGKVFYDGYERTFTLIDYEGNAHPVPPYNVPTDSAVFRRVQAECEKRGMLSHSKLAEADCIKFKAMDAFNVALEMVQKDPAILLCDNPRCSVCVKAKEICKQTAR